MSLPFLYFSPQTPDDWRRWSANHAINHYDIVSTINGNYNTPQTLTTNAASLAGATLVQFASVPETLQQAVVPLGVIDLASAAIPAGATMTAYSSTEIALSEPVVSPGVADGDDIQLSPVTPVNLQQFSLDPMDLNNLGFWFYQHQLMHSQANAILGISGYDLLGLDWSDPDEFAEWLRLNGDEQTRQCAMLGIG